MPPRPNHPRTHELSLLAAARAGSECAFGTLVDEHRAGLEMYCYLMLGDPDAARHAVEEAILAAWCERGMIDAHTGARMWLCRAAARVCIETVDGRPMSSGRGDRWTQREQQ